MKKDVLGEIVLQRKGSGKATLKEKFVVIYDSFFNGVDISNSSPQFWEELFLLKVNLSFLERCFVLTIEEKLLEMKLIFNKIFYHSVKFLQDKNHIKIARSIETQEALLRGIFRKKFTNFGIHTLTLICGIEDAEIYFIDFLNAVNSLLIDPEIPLNFKKELINLLVIITTATDNLNSNTILEYFKLVDLFPSILQFITSNQIDLATFTSGIFVLELLANYQKFEVKNPYFDSIKNLHQSDCILPIAQLFTQQLQNMISHHQSFSPNNISFMQKITSIFSFWSPSTTLESNVNINNNNNNNNNNNTNNNNNQLVNNVSIQRMNSSLLTFYEFYPAISQFLFINSVNQQENYNDVLAINKRLISNFLKVCSYILVDIQDIHHAYYSKICLIILLQMSEDIHASKLLHDVNNRLDFTLITPNKGVNENPPVVVVLDLLVQFMNNNLKKNMQFDLFLKSLSIIQRIICYEKKSSTQLKYHWKYLWDSLFRVVKFISVPKWFSIPEVSQISLGITTIFNLFITYGDIFLSSNSDYDELYYELIHQSKLLQQFTILAENSSARILSQQLENINIIIRHFSAKIDQWQDENPTLTLSQEQVILIIKSNYLSLKLNLLDGIDTFDTYAENPKENPFFRQFLRLVIFDYKTTLEVKNIDVPIK